MKGQNEQKVKIFQRERTSKINFPRYIRDVFVIKMICYSISLSNPLSLLARALVSTETKKHLSRTPWKKYENDKKFKTYKIDKIE
jgi:hypothetical protein